MAVFQPHEVREIALTAIAAVASDDLLAGRLVLKGGNALQLVYGIGSRASVDLDFSIAGDIDPALLRDSLGRALAGRFQAAGYVVFDFTCEPRPADSATKVWGGYTAEFKLHRRSEPQLIERSELRRLGKRRAPTPAPSSLTEAERLDVWRRNSPLTYKIDVSKHEHVQGHERTVVQNHDCAVYSPAMIAAEKLRAICQQMPEYRERKHPAPRSRDFYDLHALAKSRFQVDVAADPDLVKAMFEAKEVPLGLLGLVNGKREFHRTNWGAVVASIADERPELFDFYFDFVLGEIERLQPLWKP